MTLAFNLLCRVIRRRLDNGEELDMILKDYPKLTDEERDGVRSIFDKEVM